MKKYLKHLPHYLGLFGILVFGFSAFLYFSYDRSFQFFIAVFTGVSYVVWGIMHHAIHKDLYFEIFLEYLAVAILGVSVIFLLLGV